ncbi:uncharacterized protein LOC141608240 [Silene latifolia]|uniref:uncharacterized protein LOC141608240 n=1 Tax=Silene latifolia TaxID=37657 RepID=UPI003D775071
MNNPTKQHEIKRFLNHNKVGLFGLVETRIKSSGRNNVEAALWENWSICTNSGLHSGGSIWLIWDSNSYEVCVHDITIQSIHAQDERIGGAMVTNAKIQPLRRLVYDCNLSDLKARGDFYTLTNKHEHGSKVYSRIDRVLCNEFGLDDYPDNYAHFLPEGSQAKEGHSFKYFNMWSLSPDFEDVVGTSWTKEVKGTPMFQVVRNLKVLKGDLKTLNKEQFGNIENLTHITGIALNQIQTSLVQDPLNKELCDAELQCAKELKELRMARDQFLRQKAKCEWLKLGDDNTSYFHARLKSRRSRNRVCQVKDMNNKLCCTEDEIQGAFVQFYQSLLGTSKPVRPVSVKMVQAGRYLDASHCNTLNAHVTA